MNLLHQSHQAFFFCNNEDISPTPPIIGALLQALGRFNLIPTIGTEFIANTGTKRQFVIMVNSDESRRVEFLSNGISIQGQGTSADAFLHDVINFMESLQSVFPGKKSNRISLLNTRIFNGTPEQYDALYKNLFTFTQVSPFEWDNRIVEKKTLPNSSETINSISSIRRCEIKVPQLNNGQSIDSALFEIDSNTVPEHSNLRFGFEDAIAIWKELSENNQALIGQLSRYE
ncbi:hypothetical protein [Vibrio sp. OPT10]|uniref:hypothetical protein n=1 Tax=Vibrio sp. OPT10 TaxID=2778640 RepID=UPI00187F8716|nr:hypothetical protein [Vibrio sp. OPT10]MBE8607924.1 hypothetical protein [Vibrio sp. OPT10]